MKPNQEAYLEESYQILDNLGVTIVDIKDLESESAISAIVVESVDTDDGLLISIKLDDDYIAEFHVVDYEVKPFLPYLSDRVIVSMQNREGELVEYHVGYGFDESGD